MEKRGMSVQMPVRVKSLVAQIVEILTQRIKSGVYARESQIPAEHQLSTEFDVSRATIRSAIRILVERHLLFKRRGVGTFVTSLNQLNNPLHEAEDFDHLIRKNGSVPSVSYVDVQLVEAAEHLADVLQLEPGAKVLRSYKIFSADDQPVIYCKNMVPVTILGEARAKQVISEPRITEPFFDFLEDHAVR
jgi:GntR family transcriptional regulator